MQSSRILLSDRHFHQLQLSEQQVGVVIHALTVLKTAYDEEPQYAALLDNVLVHLRWSLEQSASTKTNNDVQP
jgi:hypothetical protein